MVVLRMFYKLILRREVINIQKHYVSFLASSRVSSQTLKQLLLIQQVHKQVFSFLDYPIVSLNILNIFMGVGFLVGKQQILVGKIGSVFLFYKILIIFYKILREVVLLNKFVTIS
eukprot:TRINITY_DN4129_c0_g1_i7.p3 TRINITY_DN4129_c0_g1~~TRINITY_DN4129_c0_g1_i7.p3  ORF type:complete len:115 (-),score=1.32 TRINITY_DN4129_c0_g1_i7:468-812(-)